MTTRTVPIVATPSGLAPLPDVPPTVGTQAYRIGRNEKVIGIAVDTVSATVSVALGVWWSSVTEPVLPPIWMTALFVPIVILLFAVQSLYRHKLGRNFIDEFGPIETNVALAAVLVLVIMTLSGAPHTAGSVISKTWVCAAVLMPLPRFFHAMIQKRMRKNLSLIHISSPRDGLLSRMPSSA